MEERTRHLQRGYLLTNQIKKAYDRYLTNQTINKVGGKHNIV